MEDGHIQCGFPSRNINKNTDTFTVVSFLVYKAAHENIHILPGNYVAMLMLLSQNVRISNGQS
jgi:hypothetical protein